MIKKYLVLVIILVISIEAISAQVMIGIGEKPLEGALLQLKNLPNVPNGLANASKGVMLPRVNLKSSTNLYPMFAENDSYYSSNKVTEDQKHVGLIAYNLADLRITITVPDTDCGNAIEYKEDGVTVGPVVWNGVQWRNLSKSKEDNTQEGTTGYDNVFVVNDHEGNSYTYSKFGDAGYWMTSSLITKTPPPSINSNLTYSLWSVPKTTVENSSEAFYGYPRKQLQKSITSNIDFIDNKSVGLLYSRGAISGGTPIKEGMQGICPDGWHIPSSNEYSLLYSEIMNNLGKYTTTKSSVGVSRSQAITTKCTLFGYVFQAVSKPAVKGGFSFIMSAWADSDSGQTANYNVFEIASVTSNKLSFQAGSFGSGSENIETGEWNNRQMITIRCKKN